MIRNRKKKWVLWSAGIAFFILLCIAAFWQGLAVRRYTVQAGCLDAPVRLALLTDLHSTRYGEGQEELIRAIRKEEPDLILLAGDIADDEVPHDAAWELLSVIAEEYPCYYVTGNHEFWSGEADRIKETIRSFGVKVLEGNSDVLDIHGQALQVSGVDDPEGFLGARSDGNTIPEGWIRQFQAVSSEIQAEVYSILVSHRPELVGYYESSGFDLVVAGHAHGGQVRIPGLLNGLLAPNQGLFPEYAGGQYALGETDLVVSRGLSRSRLPRIFNPPELVVIDLQPVG